MTSSDTASSDTSTEHNLPALHQTVLQQINILQTIAQSDARLAAIYRETSLWSVGDHIEHLVRSGMAVMWGIDRAMAGDGTLDGSPTATGTEILRVGWIPRGAGQAPPMAQPKGLEGPRLRARLERFGKSFARLENQLEALAQCRHQRPHLYFGDLTPPQWFRFLDIHQRHHLGLLREILRQVADAQ